MAVRTARLGRGDSGPAGGVHVAYTCPPGRTAILKDVRVWAGSGALTQGGCGVRSGSATVYLVIQAFTNQEAVQRQGFVVLEPGDEVVVFSLGGVFTYWLGGAELDGVAP